MPNAATLLQLFSLFSLASLQKPYVPFFRDAGIYVCMSGLLLFLLTCVLVFGLADADMEVYLTKATRGLLPEGYVARGLQVDVPLTYESFTSASVTMSVVAVLAVLLCVSFVLQLALDGMQACIAPMVALTLRTVKPKCWDNADDYRGKVPPAMEPN